MYARHRRDCRLLIYTLDPKYQIILPPSKLHPQQRKPNSTITQLSNNKHNPF
jgi:hypothetical protein